MLSAVLAVVGAEPWYASLGYGYGVNVAHPTGTSFARVDRLDGLGYGLYGYGRKKRDAEADADAYYGYGGYGYGLGVGGHYGGGSSVRAALGVALFSHTGIAAPRVCRLPDHSGLDDPAVARPPG